jgi:site-specific DNA recombinase
VRRAVGIVRVSQPKGREGESFSSPKDQREAIKVLASEQGWEISDEMIFDELKVSGDSPLEDRPGLSRAVTAILTGAAEILVGAYSERLWWSHEVRSQVLRLVVEAGGEVWAVDTGLLSGGTAADDFSSEVRTSADRFSRRQNAEKARKGVERAVARGVCPFAEVPPGLALDGDNRVVLTDELPIARAAFKMRDEEATIKEVRAFLARHGIERSYHGVTAMLANRLYVGEIHFGKLVNLRAHDVAIDRDLFNRVQGARVSRGRRASSDRLLARLGVLVCGNCGSRMVVGTGGHGAYNLYRCPPVGDCTERVAIGAEIAEKVVVDAVKARLADVKGRASAERDADQADIEADQAQENLEAAIRAFGGLEGEVAAAQRITELTEARDQKRERADHLRGLNSARTVSVEDWDDLTVVEQRGLIRGTVERASVSKGKPGAGRVSVRLFGE